MIAASRSGTAHAPVRLAPSPARPPVGAAAGLRVARRAAAGRRGRQSQH
ncbi:hypothetical protein AZ78_2330 [Lysobacter capsici AZ78]|uniref:Uncharacterized protein n=1 Tax=Lysobacter capsici AZ78 TaxID=1444315 RepID=A0A108U908_9GAMM|nr:hypothetical protein AZ78_2330 [Lysobacter capsici AZ78]